MSERVLNFTPQAQGPGEDPLSHYTRVFARFLQLVFGVFEKGSFHWNADDALSDIVITDQATIRKDVVEKRPTIVLSRGPVALTNMAIDQFAGPLLQKNAAKQTVLTPNYVPATGTRRHTDLSSGSMTYNCLSKEGLEAQRLAWLAAKATRTLKRALMKAGMHRVGEEVQIGSESAPGSIVQPDSNEIVMVSVSVPFYFQDNWSVAPFDKSLLTRVDMALRSEVGGVTEDNAAASIRDPSIYGQTLDSANAVSLNSKVLAGPWKAPKPRKL